MKMHNYQSFLIVSIGLLLHDCTKSVNDNHSMYSNDTVRIVQTILTNTLLESEIMKDFGNQQFKLIEGPATKSKQQFIFAGKPVKVVPSTGNIYQIHEQHPKELYVSIPTIRLFSKDSAAVMMIFHAGNATSFFNLKNEDGKWIIKKRQDGKF